MYRDPTTGGADFDQQPVFGIYGYKNGIYEYIIELGNIASPNIENVDLTDFVSCGGIKVEKGRYDISIVLSTTDYEYYKFTYQRCCRDMAMTNIVDPGETGIAISIDIYPKTNDLIGNSPLPGDLFPVLVGLNSTQTFDMSLQKEENTFFPYNPNYTISKPQAAGGIDGANVGDPQSCTGVTPNNKNCPPPYGVVSYIDEDEPYGANSNVTIDPITGIMTFDVSEQGYNSMALTIENYNDNGEIMSRIQQQFVSRFSDCITSTSDQVNDDLSVWPNPTNDRINCNIELDSYKISTTSGIPILIKENINSDFSNESIDISSISAGLYLFQCTTKFGKIYTKKIVKL